MTSDKKYTIIGERIKALREAKFADTSITDFAKIIGVKYTRYLNWESGLNRPLPDEAAVLCDKLGSTMDFIYRGKEDALPQSTIKALSERSRLSAQSTSTASPD